MRSRCLRFGACLLISAQLLAAALPVLAVEPLPEQLVELDDVVVNGTRVIDQIVALEDRFFKLYNELNKNDDFDMNCTQIGTEQDSMITSRACLPVFFVDAVAETIRWNELCKPMSADDLQGPPCYTPPAADFVLYARQEELEKNVLKVINSDPRLKDMNRQRTDLEMQLIALNNRYAELQRQKDEANGETREQRLARVRCERPAPTRTGTLRCQKG